MPEISTVAVITAKPDTADQVLEALTALAVETHKEPGCLRYSLQRGIEDPNIFITIEKWESPESLQQHLASDHVQQVLAVAGDLLAAPPVIVPAAPTGAGDPAKSAF